MVPDPALTPQSDAKLVVHRRTALARRSPSPRIDTPIEVDYYRAGGILPFVLRQLLQGLTGCAPTVCANLDARLALLRFAGQQARQCTYEKAGIDRRGRYWWHGGGAGRFACRVGRAHVRARGRVF